MEVPQGNLSEKFEILEQVFKEIRICLSRTEDNAINGESRQQDLGIIVDSLQKENEVLKRDVDQLHAALVDIKASKDCLLEKFEALEQELEESKTLLSKKDEEIMKVKQDLTTTVDLLQKENKSLKCEVDEIAKKAKLTKKSLITTVVSLREENKSLKCEVEEITKNAELAKEDLITTMDSLKKGNKALKCEVDENAETTELAQKGLTTSVDSLQKENKALKCEVDELSIKAELAKKDHITTVDSLRKENQALKCEVDQLRLNVDSLKSEMAREVQRQDSFIEKLEHQLDMKKLEIEQIRSKSKVFEQYWSAENIKKLIDQVNVTMDNGDIDSAANTLTSYIFNNNFNLVHIFNKISRMKELLKSFEEQLLDSDSFSSITLTYRELKNNTDYPNLLLNVEKKLLRFCRDYNYHATAFSLCDTLIRIKQCKDAWLYFEQGELLFLKGNYKDAREAYFFSLKFSKEGDSDLQIKYERACKALQLQVSKNKWTLFHSDGTPLTNKTLHSKYLELIRYYHPDKQYGFVKQYQDVAEYMSKELTQVYRSISNQ